MADHNDSTTTIFFALGANTFIAIAKRTAAWLTGSSSMLAEAVHSIADCGKQGLLLFGLNRSARQPDAQFPLGHRKAIYFWSFIVALRPTPEASFVSSTPISSVPHRLNVLGTDITIPWFPGLHNPHDRGNLYHRLAFGLWIPGERS